MNTPLVRTGREEPLRTWVGLTACGLKVRSNSLALAPPPPVPAKDDGAMYARIQSSYFGDGNEMEELAGQQCRQG